MTSDSRTKDAKQKRAKESAVGERYRFERLTLPLVLEDLRFRAWTGMWRVAPPLAAVALAFRPFAFVRCRSRRPPARSPIEKAPRLSVVDDAVRTQLGDMTAGRTWKKQA